MSDVIEQVKEYYGKQLQSSKDLKTSACCSGSESLPIEARALVPLLAEEILNRFYGCGSPLPPLLNGMTVLDLGCGTGRDVYLAAGLVGEKGHVIGVDMTSEQLEVALRYEDYECEQFGYQTSNVSFHQAYIEDLAACGIADESIDVVISNCVINLSPAKEQVFKEIYRVLKPGGELYFSDVFADRRVPASVASNAVARGECLGGALYTEDFRRLMNTVGFQDFRYITMRGMTVDDQKIADITGNINFTSCTVRAFKLAGLEDRCEDYGQVATYQGSIPNHPHFFDLDDHHRFYTGKPMLVCGNTAAMVDDTRYATAFTVSGNRNLHHGLFDCSSSNTGEDCGQSSCCC